MVRGFSCPSANSCGEIFLGEATRDSLGQQLRVQIIKEQTIFTKTAQFGSLKRALYVTEKKSGILFSYMFLQIEKEITQMA